MAAPRLKPAILSCSRVSRALLREARRYADVDATVLLTGETGVGKDALARYLHLSGPRSREPFVTVDCPALSATLVEVELFGHERGAFTDASIARTGRFERAARGTIYLDAVTALDGSAQGALLRVIEERTVTRLGGTTEIAVAARIIASADAAVGDLVADGAFRADLFHRLQVLPIHILPLRERRAEILPLARRFIRGICCTSGRAVATIDRDAEDALLRYHWPGNIRELRHVMERIILAGVGDSISVRDLPIDLLDAREGYLTPAAERPPTLDEVERRYILLVLNRTRGNQTRAAAMLGISRKSLWEKRKQFGLR